MSARGETLLMLTPTVLFNKSLKKDAGLKTASLLSTCMPGALSAHCGHAFEALVEVAPKGRCLQVARQRDTSPSPGRNSAQKVNVCRLVGGTPPLELSRLKNTPKVKVRRLMGSATPSL